MIFKVDVEAIGRGFGVYDFSESFDSAGGVVDEREFASEHGSVRLPSMNESPKLSTIWDERIGYVLGGIPECELSF